MGGFVLCMLLHATSEPAQYGLLIDFVGRGKHIIFVYGTYNLNEL
jgi:hypothetical protein